MSHRASLIICFISVTAIISTTFSQSLINLGIGPTWPKNIRGTEKPYAWNATVEYARVFDYKLGVGCDIDFSWNVVKEESKLEGLPLTQTKTISKRFMFPVSLFIQFDPVPKNKVHPVIKGQVGFNMMVKSKPEVNDTVDGTPYKYDESGFYYGVIGKVTTDVLLDVGEQSAFFAGAGLQWGNLMKKIDVEKGAETSEADIKEKVLGPVIRMGVSFLF